jgi:hypothetical protein
MGLFSFGNRGLARKLAEEGIAPLFAPLERLHSISRSRLAVDPYVLGFVAGTAAGLAQVESKGRLAPEKLGTVLIAVLREVFGSNAEQAITLTMDLGEQGDADFVCGQDRAGKLVSLCYGVGNLENDPEVVAARHDFDVLTDSGALSPVSAHSSANAQFLGYLQTRFFTGEVKNRIDL